ncbi:MAG: thrombospondin N-terminal-like domain-containing protein [Parcubacteria group bacterium Gr01-1014_3]|nr:MAG: thrombospondin N-terminal-like domain-containing protein [Parcubacteria group bacterium Gr01-1014_3]
MRRFLIILSFLAIGLLVILGWQPISAATRQVVNLLKNYNGLSDGLVGYWTFDGPQVSGTAVTDSSSSGNSGTLTSGATIDPGVVGQSLKLDGANDYVSVGDPASGVLDFGTGNFSSSFWIRAVESAANIIIGKRQSGAPFVGYLIYHDTANIAIQLNDTAQTPYGLGAFTTACLQQWCHVVVTINRSTNQAIYYLNGALVATVDISATTGSLDSTGGFSIGRDDPDGAALYAGLLDEIRMYNRAISAAEVAYLYNKNAPEKRTQQNVNKNNSFGDGLVGFWPFNGADVSGTTATDLGSGGNNGTLTGGPIVYPGLVGQALKFDGTNDHVNITAPTVLQSSSTFTVSLWAESPSYKANPMALAIRNGTDPNQLFALYPYDTTNGNGARVFYSGASIINQNNGSIANTGWHHFLFVSRSSTDHELFVDGSSVGTSATSKTLPATLTNVTIGAWEPNAQWYSGSIDEVRVYDRALSAAEVAALYKSGAPDKRSEANVNQNKRFDGGLVGFWPFNGPDVSGTVATDRGSGGNNGTLTGGPSVDVGVIGQALKFDNTDDYVTIADATDRTAYTIAAWVQPTDITSTSIFVNTAGNPVTTWSHQIRITSASKFESYTFDGAAQSVIGNTTIIADQWYFVVGTAENSGSLRLYVNGVEDGTADTVGTLYVAGTNYMIGSNSGNSMGFFGGKIDEVRYYNRALSATEIAEIYKASRRE